MQNRIARNRQSPKNEADFIDAYKQINKHATKKNDGYDVSAVVTKDGTPGYGLLKQELNRSHDRDYHIVKDFIPTSAIKKKMKSNSN